MTSTASLTLSPNPDYYKYDLNKSNFLSPVAHYANQVQNAFLTGQLVDHVVKVALEVFKPLSERAQQHLKNFSKMFALSEVVLLPSLTESACKAVTNSEEEEVENLSGRVHDVAEFAEVALSVGSVFRETLKGFVLYPAMIALSVDLVKQGMRFKNLRTCESLVKGNTKSVCRKQKYITLLDLAKTVCSVGALILGAQYILLTAGLGIAGAVSAIASRAILQTMSQKITDEALDNCLNSPAQKTA